MHSPPFLKFIFYSLISRLVITHHSSLTNNRSGQIPQALQMLRDFFHSIIVADLRLDEQFELLPRRRSDREIQGFVENLHFRRNVCVNHKKNLLFLFISSPQLQRNSIFRPEFDISLNFQSKIGSHGARQSRQFTHRNYRRN